MSVTAIAPGGLAAAQGAPAPDARQRILEAAMRCFTANGFHSSSMSQVCAAANMSPGGVYRYFSSKDDIIAAIVDFCHQRNRELLGRFGTGAASLEGFCDVGFECLKDILNGPEGALFCEVIAEAGRNPSIRSAFGASYLEAHGTLRQVVEKMQLAGTVDRTLDTDAVATLLLALSDGLLVRLRLDKTTTFETLWPGLRGLVMRVMSPTTAAPAATRP